MTVATYPAGFVTVDTVAYQRMAMAANPDRINPGLAVSVVSGLTMRLSVGSAVVGGFEFVNFSTLDLATTANTGTGKRTDIFVLRLTITADSTTAGAHADIQPLILHGGNTSTNTVAPTLAATLGVGTYDVPVALWTVAAGAAVIADLVQSGPGRGAVVWNKLGVSIPTSQDWGVTGLYPAANPAGAYGPQPVQVSDPNLSVTISGIYAISFTANALTTLPTVRSFIMIRLPAEEALDPFTAFNLATIAARASVSRTVYIPAGYTIQPFVYQDTGSAVTMDVTLSVARVG